MLSGVDIGNTSKSQTRLTIQLGVQASYIELSEFLSATG